MSRTRRILSVTIKHEPDVHPDTSYIGEYSDLPDPYFFDRTEGKMLKTLERDKNYEIPEPGREYRFFKPYAGEEEPGTRLYIKYGKQDFDRMEHLEKGNWYFMGITAEARVHLGSDIVQRIHSGGLWGIESDSGEAHIKEAEQGEMGALRDQLKAIGFAEEYIDEAFKSIKEEEG